MPATRSPCVLVWEGIATPRVEVSMEDNFERYRCYLRNSLFMGRGWSRWLTCFCSVISLSLYGIAFLGVVFSGAFCSRLEALSALRPWVDFVETLSICHFVVNLKEEEC